MLVDRLRSKLMKAEKELCQATTAESQQQTGERYGQALDQYSDLILHGRWSKIVYRGQEDIRNVAIWRCGSASSSSVAAPVLVLAAFALLCVVLRMAGASAMTVMR